MVGTATKSMMGVCICENYDGDGADGVNGADNNDDDGANGADDDDENGRHVPLVKRGGLQAGTQFFFAPHYTSHLPPGFHSPVSSSS